MTLGYDASTTIVGWAISNNNKIEDAGFINISKYKTIKDKSFCVLDIISKNKFYSKITRINLESALSGFMRGRTSQQTVILLARFNAVFEYINSEFFKMDVNLYPAMTARKMILGKSHVKGIKPKEYVKLNLPTFHPEIKKFEVTNSKGKWDEHNLDMYDAAIISLLK